MITLRLPEDIQKVGRIDNSGGVSYPAMDVYGQPIDNRANAVIQHIGNGYFVMLNRFEPLTIRLLGANDETEDSDNDL